MTTTFKELPCNAQFCVLNANEIIHNRGDKPLETCVYGKGEFIFTKRDDYGGNIGNRRHDGWYDNTSVYYRIEPDNEVETV